MERGVRIKINHDSQPGIGDPRVPKKPLISYTCREPRARRKRAPPLGGAWVGPGSGRNPAQLQPEPLPEVAAEGTGPAPPRPPLPAPRTRCAFCLPPPGPAVPRRCQGASRSSSPGVPGKGRGPAARLGRTWDRSPDRGAGHSERALRRSTGQRKGHQEEGARGGH